MALDEVVRRRFGPGQPTGPCADPQCVICTNWECQSRMRCRLSFSESEQTAAELFRLATKQMPDRIDKAIAAFRSVEPHAIINRAALYAAINAEADRCADIALAIDSGRGNEKEIARTIRAATP